MPKRYLGIIFVYFLAQFAIVPFVILVEQGILDLTLTPMFLINFQVGSFILALAISLFLLRKERHLPPDPMATDTPRTILWMIAGTFMAFFSQTLVNLLQRLIFGEVEQSQNTLEIMSISINYPLFILLVTVVGPILEELIFRKIIFGEIYKRSNFILATAVSSLLFALVHVDFTHLLVYFVMGIVFSFLYVKTKRIIVPIVAHVLMNTGVVVIQFLYQSPELQELIEQIEQLQFIFFGG